MKLNQNSNPTRMLLLMAAFGFFFTPLHGQTFVNVASDMGVSALPQSINFGSGVSFYDFNEDGLDDLSFTMTNDSLRFYLNTGTGFELLPSFAYANGESKHVLWVDYDNDGDLDFMLTINNGRYKLYRNDGNLQFTDVSVEAGLSIENERHYGVSFGDYDKDGFLDFYVCTYALDAGSNFYNANNHLYHNNGDGTFTDVTLSAGVADGIRLSFQSVWIDYDLDGWLDLFVINDRLYANSLYRNNGDGTFTDVSAGAGVQFAGQDPMTASIGDFDNDGDLDIYMTNTGVQPKNPMMLVNNGNLTYTNQSEVLGLHLPHWTWGAVWVDFDNDTWQDLYVTSGNPSVLIAPVQNFFYGNAGGNIFLPANDAFIGNHNARSYSTARGDINNDGFYDIVALNQHPFDVFLWQNSGNTNNYIKITLQGTASNRMAISSWIKVYAAGNKYTQWTLCGENYLSQNSQHHIFGLSSFPVVDSVQVIYLSGHMDTYYNLAVNQWYHFTEGDNISLEINADGNLNLCEGETVTLDAGLHAAYHWSTGHTGQFLTVDQSGMYSVTVYNEIGVYKTDSVEVTISPQPELFISADNANCFGASTGSVLIQNLTGIEAESVVWSNGSEGELLTELPAGIYSYVYTDVNGCTALGDVNISQPAELVIETFVQPENAGNDGSIFIFPGGGVPPYIFFLNGAVQAQALITGLTQGTYTVGIEDANGCTQQVEVIVSNISNTRNVSASKIEVYPNPASDLFFIKCPECSGSPLRVQMRNTEGKIVDSKAVSFNDPNQLPSNIAPGVYTLELIDGKEFHTIRIAVYR